MDETKTLGYDWEFGHEELTIEVNSYANNGSLYIGLYHLVDGYPESFGDLTVNLPYGGTRANEAYIDDFSSKSKLQFIKKYKLGKVLPEKGHSGYVAYNKVAFDLERLTEFDKEGVDEFRRLHDIPKEKKPKAKRKTEKER